MTDQVDFLAAAVEALSIENGKLQERIAELEEQLDYTSEQRRLAEIDCFNGEARIAELENLLKPFAQLNANWFGDKIPLQPKSVMLEPLPVLYASKYFSEQEK